VSVPQAKRLKELEKENERLRKAVSDSTLDKKILMEAVNSLYVGQSCGDESSHSRNEGEFNKAT